MRQIDILKAMKTDTPKPKLTLNRLLDIIEALPVEKRREEKIQKLKQNLLNMKFDEKNKGFGGNIVLDNTEQLLTILEDE